MRIEEVLAIEKLMRDPNVTVRVRDLYQIYTYKDSTRSNYDTGEKVIVDYRGTEAGALYRAHGAGEWGGNCFLTKIKCLLVGTLGPEAKNPSPYNGVNLGVEDTFTVKYIVPIEELFPIAPAKNRAQEILGKLSEEEKLILKNHFQG